MGGGACPKFNMATVPKPNTCISKIIQRPFLGQLDRFGWQQSMLAHPYHSGHVVPKGCRMMYSRRIDVNTTSFKSTSYARWDVMGTSPCYSATVTKGNKFRNFL